MTCTSTTMNSPLRLPSRRYPFQISRNLFQCDPHKTASKHNPPTTHHDDEPSGPASQRPLLLPDPYLYRTRPRNVPLLRPDEMRWMDGWMVPGISICSFRSRSPCWVDRRPAPAEAPLVWRAPGSIPKFPCWRSTAETFRRSAYEWRSGTAGACVGSAGGCSSVRWGRRSAQRRAGDHSFAPQDAERPKPPLLRKSAVTECRCTTSGRRAAQVHGGNAIQYDVVDGLPHDAQRTIQEDCPSPRRPPSFRLSESWVSWNEF
jgi:hypothetical protein